MPKVCPPLSLPLHWQFERFRRLFHHTHYRTLLSHKSATVLSTVYISQVGGGKLRSHAEARLRVRGVPLLQAGVVGNTRGTGCEGEWS